MTVLAKIRHLQPEYQPPESELLTLARALKKRQEWDSCVGIYKNLLQVAPGNLAGRLELAEILTFVQKRPAAAKRLLEQLPQDKLTEKQSSRLRHLQSEIREMIESGVLEIRDP